MESRPQWTYFMLERKFFEDTLFVEEQIRNTPSWQTCIYRNLLFAFAKLRKYVKFDFKFNETDEKCEVNFSFDNKNHERSFFHVVYLNKYDENDYKTIQYMLNNYFFEFVSDLSSISQTHGYNLFPYIYPPAFVRNYYNILIVSKIIVDEFDRLERINPQDEFIRDVVNFMSKKSQGFSGRTLDFVCNNLCRSSKVPYKTFRDGLDKQIRSNDDSYVREIKYLLKRHKLFGPYFLDYKPVSFHMCGQDSSVIPRYLRIDNQVEEPRIKYVQFAHYLQAWKELEVDYLDSKDILLSRHTLNGQDIVENTSIDFELIDGLKVENESPDNNINGLMSPIKEKSEQKPIEKSPVKLFTKSNRRMIKTGKCCSDCC